ncbi:hypothetical protein N665_7465s0002 [Sinapis alba]|nr:hypothetical protein N665_7465s0002 [Sinapis alba]
MLQIGLEMIHVFSESVGIQMNLVKLKAIMGQGFVGDLPVILAKPQTYMNLSGESVICFFYSYYHTFKNLCRL